MKRDHFDTGAEQSAYNFGALEAFRLVNEALKETRGQDRTALIDAILEKHHVLFPELVRDAC